MGKSKYFYHFTSSACSASNKYICSSHKNLHFQYSCWDPLKFNSVLGGQLRNYLKYVRVPAITNSECQSAYNGNITESMICDGYPNEGKGHCTGDEGGAFVCNDKGKAVAVGVISWGFECGGAYPGVNARNTYALNWIKTNMVITNIALRIIAIS